MARRITAVVLCLLGLSFVLVADAAPARAACAESPDVVNALRRADVVFVGKVDSLASNDRVAAMKVVEIWKGPLLDSIVLVYGGDPDGASSGPNDRTYQEGRTYLVVPSNDAQPFADSLCTATMLFRPNGSIPAEYTSVVGSTAVRYTEAAEAERTAATALESLTAFVNSPVVWGPAVGLFVVLIGAVLFRGGAKRRKAKETPKRPRRRLSPGSAFSSSGASQLRKLRSKGKQPPKAEEAAQ